MCGTSFKIIASLILIICCGFTLAEESTLELLHIIFRHGDRTNDLETIYPKDPFKNDSYYPYGYGQLTQTGKLKMYKLGAVLRQKYGDFLGDFYSSRFVHSRCSSYSRTKISLMLVMAGLFPPKNEQIWSPDLNWQPFTFDYKLKMHDLEYFGITCPNYYKLYFAYYKTKKYQNYLKKYDHLFKYLTTNTGWNVSTLEIVNLISVCLQIQEHWGFRLPEWTEKVWPTAIREANHDYYNEMTANKNLTKYAVGFLLKKILTDTTNKISGLTPDSKLYLYSAHDYNLALMLKVLDLLNLSLEPTFASYMVIELHNTNGSYALKFFYENYSNEDKYLYIPNCGVLCPFDQFLKIMDDYLPGTMDKCGTEHNVGHINEFL